MINFTIQCPHIPCSLFCSAFDTQYVHAIGFGYFNYFEAEQAKILQKVSLQILPADKCSDSKRNENKMCTYERDKDTCISDSGGPLLLNSKGRQHVVGLISYGIGCGTIYPSVNTRITTFLPWIMEKTAGEMFCRK
jgi:secreted trypsin-like serine protease